jgi:gamma-glutamyltranspeptidase/glutathione hydrolase
MVVTSQHLASDVGAEVLRKGGNAVDAAVAVGYALAVTHPCCGNLGGGGFMLIHLANGQNHFINFRERAPLAASADMYVDAQGKPIASKSLEGWLAVGTPGTVLGLETARKAFGTQSRSMLIAPAIELAQSGFIIDGGDVETFAEGNAAFARYPNVAAIFLKDGKPLAVGDRLVQTDLAASLRDISDGGTAAFYSGPIARAVVSASQANGGLLTLQDFSAYSVTQLHPVVCSYRGYMVLSAPPPSSGGVTLCEMLTILQAYPLGQYGWRSAQEVHLMTEAMRRAYFDRNTYLGDPDFINNPVDRLMGDTHAKAMRATILPDRATPSAQIGVADAPSEHANTTHYSVVDRWGNAVAVTYTINDDFGAKIIAGGTGFFLNDEMDDFTAKPGSPNGYGLVQGKANAIAPGKRPLSSMTPTILLKNGQPVMVVGTPGGARIITTVLEIIVAVVDHHVPLQEAVDAPRYHHQWLPDTLQVEPGALSPSTVAALETMGHRVTPLERWGTGNSADVIAVRPGRVLRLEGVNDIRAPGGSAVAP